MKRIISFCLFGQDANYTVGAIRNAELIKKIYPGWQAMFWIGSNVPKEVVENLKSLGAEIREAGPLNPMLARFLVHDDPEVECYLIRDTDSRLNERERGAVNEWIKIGLAFHVIRDHIGHQVPMPGGLWGGTPVQFRMREVIDGWDGNKNAGPRNAIYNRDQQFLAQCVWPLVRLKCLQHDFCCRDIFHDAKPFPAKLGDWRFCGEIFDYKDQPERYGWQRRINWMDT